MKKVLFAILILAGSTAFSQPNGLLYSFHDGTSLRTQRGAALDWVDTVIVIGEPNARRKAGAVEINRFRIMYSGTRDRCGAAVSIMGDVDGDGKHDILFGCPNKDINNDGQHLRDAGEVRYALSSQGYSPQAIDYADPNIVPRIQSAREKLGTSIKSYLDKSTGLVYALIGSPGYRRGAGGFNYIVMRFPRVQTGNRQTEPQAPEIVTSKMIEPVEPPKRKRKATGVVDVYDTAGRHLMTTTVQDLKRNGLKGLPGGTYLITQDGVGSLFVNQK